MFLESGAVINWATGLLIVVAGSMEVAFSQSFSSKVIEARHSEAYRTSYYVARVRHAFSGRHFGSLSADLCQASYIISIAALVIVILYLLWVWFDARHPMRDAFLYRHLSRKDWSDRNNDTARSEFNPTLVSRQHNQRRTGLAQTVVNVPVTPITSLHGWPTAFSFSTERLRRLQANRSVTSRTPAIPAILDAVLNV